MNDNYSHIDNRIMYVVENIPGPPEDTDEYNELIESFNSQITASCKCKEKCLIDTCECLQRSGGTNYITTDNGSKLIIQNTSNPIVECNSLCRCTKKCGNRYVQNGPINNLAVKMCSDQRKGYGLFTKRYIVEGTFICEYAGEVITKAEAIKRQLSNNSMKKMNYIYCLNEHCNGKKIQTFVDPSSFGNIGRYINHSCDPNCEIIPVRVNGPVPKLAIFSIEDIEPGTELTYNYGPNLPDNDKSADKDEKRICLCKSDNCSGLMPFHAY